MAKKTKNIMFRPERKSNDRGFRKFSAIFSVCVLMILLVSCLVILNKYDFDVRTAMGGDSLTTTQPVSQGTTEWQEEADKTYFFWCADSESKELHFAWLVNFRLPEAEVSVCTLPPDTRLSDGEETLEAVLAKSGENEAVKKLEELIGASIDGYIGSDTESFKAMINYLGGADITVPEQIEYRSEEFTVILVKGKQNIKADSLFKYLRYLGTIGARGENLQASALLEILDGVFKSSNIEKRERYFSKLSNTLRTNLSIVDYSAAENGIKAFMQSGIKERNIVDSPQEINEE
ncbi:MAG: LCP family protein [Clostridia bacterium]|nr:LCP family protein [Clostridia bacterium]MBQ4625717.1 LCP family protein [Clostridia bacterium]